MPAVKTNSNVTSRYQVSEKNWKWKPAAKIAWLRLSLEKLWEASVLSVCASCDSRSNEGF